MHNIFDLREMGIEQLLALAEELKVKGAKRMDKDTLVYTILDKEAERMPRTALQSLLRKEDALKRQTIQMNRLHLLQKL